jgi:hypothetical protein
MLDDISGWSEERKDALRMDVKARLRGVCGEWTPEDYDAIVEKIVRSTIKSLYTTLPARE